MKRQQSILRRPRRTAVALVAFIAGASLTPQLTSAQAASTSSTGSRGEEQAVLATVQRLFDAMRTKDTAAFREIFDANAKLVSMRTRQNGEQVVQVLPWDRFGAFVASDQRAPWIERAWSPQVRIRGTLATVWAEYDFHFGQTPSHCGVDAVQLLKTPAGWRIVSIADTYEPSGCPKREPPR